MKNTKNAKHGITVLIIVLSMLLMTACGKEETLQTGTSSDGQPSYTGSFSDYEDPAIGEDEGYFGLAELEDGDHPVFLYGGLTYVIIDDHAETLFTLYSVDDLETYMVRSFVEYEGQKYPVTAIGECTFTYCSEMKNCVIAPSVKTLATSAFDGAYSLESVTIPDSVTTIGDYCFSACEALTEIVIPDSVTSLGEYVFNDCTGLRKVVLPKGLTAIPDCLFSGCVALEELEIPDTVQTIGTEAFWYCEALPKLEIPDSVTAIGDRAFYDCMALEELTIPKSVTYLGEDLFDYCETLTYLKVPEEYVEDYADYFYGYDIEIVGY